MVSKKFLAAAAVVAIVLLPATAASAGRYIGRTTLGVKHWTPNPSQYSKLWIKKWLALHHAHGHDFDSFG
jgi:hypothetical protein